MGDYRDVVEEVYAEAAEVPQAALCCTQSPVWELPGLVVPQAMLDRNYGCGSTVNPRDLSRAERVLYVGVGAGLEVLQLAYFLRREGGVVAVDTNPKMLAVAAELLEEAARVNDWFEPEMVTLQEGDALDLPLDDASVDVVGQNCLFNIFTPEHLTQALRETRRVLRPRGRFVLSDPVATRPMPEHLAGDARLRALCLSGALPLDDYLQKIVDAGFGTLEVRARRPYRVLDKARYRLDADLLLESVEVVAFADPIPDDGPCIFTGKTAIYVGTEDAFDDGKGHVLLRDLPMGVCDKTAEALSSLGREDLTITGSTWHYAGDGCC
ncbi:MAG: arsenosugar biosynthesis arsenite methyltransferase ArsM [Deltaproteobacteria bacterium]|nr:arsenosugar biosynthesis arsenite methyltransferase ArsM [Deltaproteobacteria bacterium]